MVKLTWALLGIAVIIAGIVGILIGGNPQEEIDPNKVTTSGSVVTITPDTIPVRLDFIEQKSSTTLSAQLNENNEYSINLDPGRYRVELTYSIGNIVSPVSGFCGIYEIETDDDSLDLKC